MTFPVRHLPVLQNWDCHGCTACCRQYYVHVTPEEQERIARQGWDQDPELAELPLFVSDGPWFARRQHLNQRGDGRCIFLSEQGRCRIHERFGSEAKPLACRLYPFVLVPAGDHWRVGLRYACPSAAANQGRPLADHRAELQQYAAVVERQEKRDPSSLPPPMIRKGLVLAWADVQILLRAVIGILQDREHRLECRWRKCLALAVLCRQARFDKVQGARLTEFLHLVISGLKNEVPVDPGKVAAPTWVGRILFRQALALYARKDAGPDKGLAVRGRRFLLWAAWRFAVGSGPVPRIHGQLPDTTFEQLEPPAGALPDSAEEMLERYYSVKLESLQFCGGANFGMDFWEGLESLALTLPAILWLTRAFADRPKEKAVQQAIQIVDDNFGYNRLLGSRRQRLSLNILAHRGELAKLVAWYSR